MTEGHVSKCESVSMKDIHLEGPFFYSKFKNAYRSSQIFDARF